MRFLILPIQPLINDMPFQLCRPTHVFIPTSTPRAKLFCRPITALPLLLVLIPEPRIAAIFSGIRHKQVILNIIQSQHGVLANRLRLRYKDHKADHQIYIIICAIVIHHNHSKAVLTSLGKSRCCFIAIVPMVGNSHLPQRFYRQISSAHDWGCAA